MIRILIQATIQTLIQIRDATHIQHRFHGSLTATKRTLNVNQQSQKQQDKNTQTGKDSQRTPSLNVKIRTTQIWIAARLATNHLCRPLIDADP